MSHRHPPLVALVAVIIAACGGDRALTQQQFTDIVRERVEVEHPDVRLSRVDAHGFTYERGDGERRRLITDEEYAYYLRHPEDLEDLVARVVSLVGDPERVGDVEGDSTRLRRSLLPVLKPRAFLGEAEVRAAGQPVLYGEHDCGLLVFFVIDHPTAISFLTAGSLEGLGMSREELSRLALDNLARRTSEDRFVIERTAEGPIAVGETLDGYDAARLISPALLQTASELLGASRVVAAIPRRDLILLAPADSVALQERIAARARTEYHAGPFPITPDLFVVDRGGVRPLQR